VPSGCSVWLSAVCRDGEVISLGAPHGLVDGGMFGLELSLLGSLLSAGRHRRSGDTWSTVGDCIRYNSTPRLGDEQTPVPEFCSLFEILSMISLTGLSLRPGCSLSRRIAY
jgi:hypothetical protein